MEPVAALGAAATVISGAFALCTLDRWRANRRLHELAWSQSLAMFCLASAAYWWGAAAGWDGPTFRVFYLFGAILNVAYLAVGTVHLLATPEFAGVVHRAMHVTAAFCAGVVFVAPLRRPIDATGLPSGREVFGAVPRTMAAVGSGIGATVLIGGAVWSAVRLLRPRTSGTPTARVAPARLALTNAAIAIGSMILGVGGAVFTGRDAMVAFGVFLTIGVAVLFGGFLISSPAPRRTAPSKPPGLSAFGDELWDLAQPEPVRNG